MFKRILLSVLLSVSLVSFPTVSFAADTPPDSETVAGISYSRTTARLFGVASGDDISEYGFQFGLDQGYGSTVNSSAQLPEGLTYLFETQIGSDSQGSDPGEMTYPSGVAFDSQDNIFISDSTGSRVQKFDSDRNFILQFGSLGAENGQFIYPGSLAIDAQDNVYVADTGNYRVQKFDNNGQHVATFPSPGQGVYGFLLDIDGNMYISDSYISKLDPQGNLISTIGQSEYGSQFGALRSIDFGPDGILYGSATNGSQVAKFSTSGTLLEVLDLTSHGRQSVGYDSPIQVTDDGLLLVADKVRDVIEVYTTEGDYISTVVDEEWGYIQNLTLDSNGKLYVPGSSNVRIYSQFDEPGSYGLTATNLNCGTTYHYRSYSVNDAGTTYGQDQTFITEGCAQGPHNIVATPTGRTVGLTWDDAVVPSSHERYLVDYKQHGTSDWNEKIVEASQDNPSEAYLYGLLPEVGYDLRVATVFNESNREDTTAWSDVIEFTTASVNTYSVSSCRDLQAIGIDPITRDVGDPEGRYVLTQDVDCSESESYDWAGLTINDEATLVEGFFPILYPETLNQPTSGFLGELDGGGYMVSSVSQQAYIYGGVFQTLRGAYIHDISFNNLSIEVGIAFGSLGGLASEALGDVRIHDVHINGDVSLSSHEVEPLANYSSPDDVIVGPNGNIFLISGNAREILEIAETGTLVNSFGSYGSGDGQFIFPTDIAFDSQGNIYVVDISRNDVQKFSAQGEFIGKFGSQGNGEGQFDAADAVAVDAQGNIYVGDSGSNTRPVQKFDSNFDFVSSIAPRGQYSGGLNQVYDVYIDSSNDLYVADSINHVQRFVNDVYDPTFSLTGTPSPLEPDTALSRDGDGNFYAGSAIAMGVMKYSPQGEYITNIGPVGLMANYSKFAAVADSQGNVYRDTPSGGRIAKFDVDGNFVGYLGGQSINSGALNLGGVIGSSQGDNLDTSVDIVSTTTDISVSFTGEAGRINSISAGGIIGIGTGNITSSRATGSVNLDVIPSSIVGGLAGYFMGEIIDSHAANDVVVAGDSDSATYLGGLVGYAFSRGIDEQNFQIHSPHIERSYAWGSITVTGAVSPQSAIGGIAGFLLGGTLVDVFSVESISVPDQEYSIPVAGLIGGIMAEPVDVSNNAFDVTRANTAVCYGMAYSPTLGPIDAESLDCNRENEDGSDPNHFVNTDSVSPLSDWNFTDTWTTEVDQLPLLVGVDVPTGDNSDIPDDGGGGGDNDGDSEQGMNDNQNSGIPTPTTVPTHIGDSSSPNTDSTPRGEGLTSSGGSETGPAQSTPGTAQEDSKKPIPEISRVRDQEESAMANLTRDGSGSQGWLVMGRYSLTGSNALDMVMLAFLIGSVGYCVHLLSKNRREDSVIR